MVRFGEQFRLRRSVAAGALGMFLVLAGCQDPPAATPPTVAATPVATNRVAIENFAFGPPAVTVAVGSTVTWTNRDLEQHTVTARDRTFNSDAVDSGQTYAFTFSKSGTYDYVCLIHPHMVGKVVVTP